MFPGEVMKFAPDGSYEIIWAHGDAGRVAVTVDQNGVVYVGSINGEIYKGEEDDWVPFASLVTERMVAAPDGNLYAVKGGFEGHPAEIVRIDPSGEITPFISEVNGEPFGPVPVNLVPIDDLGFYVITGHDVVTNLPARARIFFIDYQGNGKLLHVFGEFAGPVPMAVSPTSGKIYYIALHELNVFTPGQLPQVLSREVGGDPWGMAISPDGKRLYISENGAIDLIHLEE